MPGTLGDWVGKYLRENAIEEVEQPLSVSERVRLSEFEIEVRRLQTENDFLRGRLTSSLISKTEREISANRNREGQLSLLHGCALNSRFHGRLFMAGARESVR